MFSSVLSKVSLRLPTASARCFSTLNGTVKWFDVKKGFGFLIPDDGSPDVFVHQTAVHAEGFRSLAEGETVEFTTKTDGAGRVSAERVTGPMGSFVQGASRQRFQPRDFGGFGGDVDGQTDFFDSTPSGGDKDPFDDMFADGTDKDEPSTSEASDSATKSL